MQRAEQPSTEVVPNAAPARPSISPLVAFAALATVVAIVAAVVFLTRSEASAPAPASPVAKRTEPAFALTDEQAIARFEELNQLRLTMYKEADVTLLKKVFLSGSAIYERVEKEIRTLRRDGVSARFSHTNVELSVVSKSYNRVRIRETSILGTRFIDGRGKNVTHRSQRERRTILWTLSLHRGEWLVSDAVITAAEQVDK